MITARKQSNNVAPTVKKAEGRKLSRYGCRNCKLRKLKCDETRPQCRRCCAYGVACNFGYNVPDLQPLHEHRVANEICRKSQRIIVLPPRALVSNGIWSSNESYQLTLDRHDQELFSRFRQRTVHSLGEPAVVSTYEDRIFQDSFTCPALMHGLLAMAAAHDRYLDVIPDAGRKSREFCHSAQCTILFSKWLSRPVEEKYRDALWATAVTLSTIVFSSLNVLSVEEAWPLKPSETSDLQWLRLKASDKALWHLANPLRPNSIFRNVSETFLYSGPRVPTRGTGGVANELTKLCELDEGSTAENNPYFDFAHALSSLLEIPSGTASLAQVFMVIGVVTDGLRQRLQEKDPIALTLLYLWYSRARRCRWWLNQRARYELPAIQKYLQLNCESHDTIQTILRLTYEQL